MNANYITAYLMPEMPIAESSEFSTVHFYSSGFHGGKKSNMRKFEHAISVLQIYIGAIFLLGVIFFMPTII